MPPGYVSPLGMGLPHRAQAGRRLVQRACRSRSVCGAWAGSKWPTGVCERCGLQPRRVTPYGRAHYCGGCSEARRLEMQRRADALRESGVRSRQSWIDMAGPVTAAMRPIANPPTLEHPNLDGAQHRRELAVKNIRGNSIYRLLKKTEYPKGYRVLCFNCNWAIGHYDRVCPHQAGGLIWRITTRVSVAQPAISTAPTVSPRMRSRATTSSAPITSTRWPMAGLAGLLQRSSGWGTTSSSSGRQ